VHSPNDTIAAIATPPGRGGVGVIRVSGPDVPALARRLFGRLPEPRVAELHRLCDIEGQPIDQGLVLYFPAPHSFTGEQVLELHGHGGPVVMDLLMSTLLALGARPARPGEFSERAFLNDKLDLVQAEAIADLIDSATQQAARAAARSLQGEFSARIEALVEQLVQLRVYIEAAIDFPEEEIDFPGERQVRMQLSAIETAFQDLFRETRQGCLLHEGLTLVIAGQPNAGKSSLLNALSGRETAIVTALPGTTRDFLREQIQLDGMPLHLIDTAGLRDSEDEIEREGVRRAWAQIEQADRVLLLVDDQQGFGPADQQILDRLPSEVPHTLVFNKIDLTGAPAGLRRTSEPVELALSVVTGAGLDALRSHLKQVAGFRDSHSGSISARRRHLEALQRAHAHVHAGIEALEQRHAGELLAEELRLAQQSLGEITGVFTSDDLLGAIFASFCIGK